MTEVNINDLIEKRAEIKRETEQLNVRLKDLKSAQDEIDLALLKKMDAVSWTHLALAQIRFC